MAQQYEIRITGGLVSIIRVGRKSRAVFIRRIVSPPFIRVWYSVKEARFDRESWDALPLDEKMYMSRIASLTNLDSEDLAVASASLVQDIHKRLTLIESAVIAGNLNKALVEEYLELVDKLAEAGSINHMMSSHMKRVIRNRYADLLSEAS